MWQQCMWGGANVPCRRWNLLAQDPALPFFIGLFYAFGKAADDTTSAIPYVRGWRTWKLPWTRRPGDAVAVAVDAGLAALGRNEHGHDARRFP